MNALLVLVAAVAVLQHQPRTASSASAGKASGPVTNATFLRKTPASAATPQPTWHRKQAQPTVALPRTAQPAARPSPAAASHLHSTAGVLLLGDSLGEGTAPYLERLLAGRPFSANDIVGGSLYSGINDLRRAGSNLPPILVLSLGTNDAPTPASFGALVNETLSIAGSRCVVWPDIVRPPSGGFNWDEANAVLASAAASHPSLHVVAWSALVRAHPQWLASDGVHVDAAGYLARAEAIAQAVASC